MEPSQPSYNTFGDCSSPEFYPTPSDQPYITPSGPSYPAEYPCYVPDPVVYVEPCPGAYSGPTVYVDPCPVVYPTPSYQAGPVYTTTTYDTVDCCGLLCCAACFGMCLACLSN